MRLESLPSKLAPELVTAVIDTREQTPLDLQPLKTVRDTLSTGDYALHGTGLSNLVCIERKSLDDLLGVVGRDRERFEREIDRMLAFPVRVLLIEATWTEIEMGQWRSKLTTAAVTGSLISWASRGIQVELVGNHERAGRFASRLLYTTARHEYERLRSMAAWLQSPPPKRTPAPSQSKLEATA